MNNLTVADLINGMKVNSRAAMLDVVEAYEAMQAGSTIVTNADGQQMLEQNGGEFDDAAAAWMRACDRFHAECGTGVVVGVLWGGYGSVHLTLRKVDDETQYRASASASVSWAGIGNSVSVAATYGHSASNIDETVNADVTSSYNGTCVAASIEAMASDLQAIAKGTLTDLGNYTTKNAELSSGTVTPPDTLDFQKPPANKKTTDMIQSVSSMSGLEAYAQAAAYDQYKKDGGEDDLATFLKGADAPNDVGGVDANPPVLADAAAASAATPKSVPKPNAPTQARSNDSFKASSNSEYEPMGLWVVNWSQLFPWLVSGADNRVPAGTTETKELNDQLRLRIFHQDCLSLARTYDILVGYQFYDLAGMDPASLRNAFNSAAAKITQFMNGAGANSSEIDGFIDKTVKGLVPDAQKIYVKWCEIEVLRSYELGGRLWSNKQSLRHLIKPTGDIRQPYYGQYVPNAFTEQSQSFEQFAEDAFVLPFIHPRGKILAVVGDYEGLSGAIVHKQAAAQGCLYFQGFFTENPDVYDFALEFERFGNRLVAYPKDSNGKSWPELRLYPIRTSVLATAPNWKGCGQTTGMGTIRENIEALKKELAGMTAWSFDSDAWQGITEVEQIRYSLKGLQPRYYGLVPDPGNVFNS